MMTLLPSLAFLTTRLLGLATAVGAAGASGPTTASNPARLAPFLDPSAPPASFLNLTNIRSILEQMENLVIFNLIQRAQYPYDAFLYTGHQQESTGKKPKHQSPLDLFLHREDELLALTGQWNLPDQVPFTQPRSQPIYPVAAYPVVLHGSAADINLNAALKDAYLDVTLPSLHLPAPAAASHEKKKKEGYAALGPTLSADAALLRLLSFRIHLGRYVAESKYVSNITLYDAPIRSCDLQMLERLVTNKTVEDANVARVEVKASTFGLEPEGVAGALYRDVLIPLTKKVEVGYLLGRLS